MTEKSYRRLVLFVIATDVLMFFLFVASEFSVHVNNWGLDLLHPINVYCAAIGAALSFADWHPPAWGCALFSFSVGAFFEMLQLWEIKLLFLPVGVFDPIDMLAYFAGSTIAFLVDTHWIRKARDE